VEAAEEALFPRLKRFPLKVRLAHAPLPGEGSLTLPALPPCLPLLLNCWEGPFMCTHASGPPYLAADYPLTEAAADGGL